MGATVEPVLPAFKYPCIEELVHSFGPRTLGTILDNPTGATK